MSRRPRILWNVFHPDLDRSRGNRAMLEGVRDLPQVQVRDLHALYREGRIDVAVEQGLLDAHDLIVFQHPFYWYSTPPLMKAWQDEVLSYGYAYPPHLGRALHGKHWWSVLTTGGPGGSYQSGGFNNFSMSELLRPLQQTAYLCGMVWRPPWVTHGVLPADLGSIRSVTDAELKAQALALREQVLAIDLDEQHALAPVLTPHAMAAPQR